MEENEDAMHEMTGLLPLGSSIPLFDALSSVRTIFAHVYDASRQPQPYYLQALAIPSV